jgi:hypothetical protein
MWLQERQRHPRKRSGVSVLSALETSACARRSRGPELKTVRREFTSAGRPDARCTLRLLRGGRGDRSRQDSASSSIGIGRGDLRVRLRPGFAARNWFTLAQLPSLARIVPGDVGWVALGAVPDRCEVHVANRRKGSCPSQPPSLAAASSPSLFWSGFTRPCRIGTRRGQTRRKPRSERFPSATWARAPLTVSPVGCIRRGATPGLPGMKPPASAWLVWLPSDFLAKNWGTGTGQYVLRRKNQTESQNWD